MRCWQGDQIGRIFAYWSIVFVEQCYEKFSSSPDFWATFFQGKSYVLILAKKGLGFVLGDFFHKLIWSPWLYVIKVGPVAKRNGKFGTAFYQGCQMV
jgi:hypothetical protein